MLTHAEEAVAGKSRLKLLSNTLRSIWDHAQVGVHYDPMIAKLVARGPDRATALARLHTALSQLQARAYRIQMLLC